MIFVLIVFNSPTSLIRRGLRRFKYFTLLSYIETPSKEKIVMNFILQNEYYIRCILIENDSIVENFIYYTFV